ncbi:DUF7620 family protein [Streptomyces sp. NPDC002248]
MKPFLRKTKKQPEAMEQGPSEEAKRAIAEAHTRLHRTKNRWDEVRQLAGVLERRGNENHFAENIRKLILGRDDDTWADS